MPIDLSRSTRSSGTRRTASTSAARAVISEASSWMPASKFSLVLRVVIEQGVKKWALKAHVSDLSWKNRHPEDAEAALRDGFSEAMLDYTCNEAVVITTR